MKRNIIILVGLIIVLMIAGMGFWRWKSAKNVQVLVDNKEHQIQVDQQSSAQQAVDTSDWTAFKNDTFKFEIKYPKNLTYALQPAFKPDEGAKFLFYDNKFADVASASNPLLAIIQKKVGYMDLTILTRKDFVDKSNFDMKNFVARDLSGQGGGAGATQKIASWQPVETIDKKTSVYFYKTDVVDAETAQSMGQASGVVWMSNGIFFQLEPKGEPQQIGDLYKNIALTFSQK